MRWYSDIIQSAPIIVGAFIAALAAYFFGAYSTDDTTNAVAATIDRFVLCFAVLLGSWAYYQTHHEEVGKLFSGWEGFAQAVSLIIGRAAVSLAQFVLVILGILAQLVLLAGRITLRLVHGLRAVVRDLQEALRPAATEIYVMYDTANHGHLANLTRQQLRAARATLAYYIRWGVAIGFVLLIISGPPTENDTSVAPEPAIRPYVVPDWVIKALPENRPRDGSSSHYRPDDYPAAKWNVESDQEGYRLLSTTGDSTETTWHSKSTTVMPETSGVEPMVTAEPATAGVAVERSLGHKADAFCAICRQRHCCKVAKEAVRRIR